MLRPVVAKRCAILSRLSPGFTTYTRNVGAGVGVGRANEGTGVGPVGSGSMDGLAAMEPAGATDGPPRATDWMQAVTTTVASRSSTGAATARRRRERATGRDPLVMSTLDASGVARVTGRGRCRARF